MSNISSSDSLAVKLMRYIARCLSILWAFLILIIASFIIGGDYESGPVVFIIALIIAFLIFLGPAILAGVWGKEAFGGSVLVVDSVLISVYFLLINPRIKPTIGLLLILFLPPLVAGFLFLTCHRKSKTSGE